MQFINIAPLITSSSGKIRKTKIDNPVTVNISQSVTMPISVQVAFRVFLNQQMRQARMNVPSSGMPNENMRAQIQAIRWASGILAKYSFWGSGILPEMKYEVQE